MTKVFTSFIYKPVAVMPIIQISVYSQKQTNFKTDYLPKTLRNLLYLSVTESKPKKYVVS